jgi:hypothetical protein
MTPSVPRGRFCRGATRCARIEKRLQKGERHSRSRRPDNVTRESVCPYFMNGNPEQ